jgi:threonine synthase
LREAGLLHSDERTVLCITGNGLKTPEALSGVLFDTLHLKRASLSEFESLVEEEAA